MTRGIDGLVDRWGPCGCGGVLVVVVGGDGMQRLEGGL